ncbi:hypothetical protein BKA70DRAFT_1572553 [Coprinopsis sp. MPI-PUGE-AT-0042]|nr:hypothetical protein BKA70DRAFT_1572553 [Coprinopsis sp. MPI-PUGE-AT-0042]
MSTPISELAIPFPSVQEPTESDTHSPDDNVTPSSQKTETEANSSKLTSSDKLSDLPPPRGGTIPERRRRPSFVDSTRQSFRRSLDASSSLPTFSTSAANDDSWYRPPHPPPSFFGRHSETRRSSPGQETPRQRFASESDNESPYLHKFHGRHLVQAALTRLTPSPRGESEPSFGSPLRHLTPLHKSPEATTSADKDLGHTPEPRSRASSPLRLFHQWSSGRRHHNRNDEPFVPINPFKRHGLFRFAQSQSKANNALGEREDSVVPGCEDTLPVLSIKAFFKDLQVAVTDSLPRQLYLNLLLRLPAMYFTRVSRIFEDAEVSKRDIQRMIDAGCRERDESLGIEHGGHHQQQYDEEARIEGHRGRENSTSLPHPPGILPLQVPADDHSAQRQGYGRPESTVHLPLPFPDEWTPTSVSPSLFRFKHSWEAFIESLLREWKTFNIVSALLSSAIVSMFQVPEAAEDPVTRTAALLSLICALMSLSYGCMYIVRFGTMRTMARASNWAEDAQKGKTLIWWNVWVLLAMPAVWMAWAMIFFIVAILSFVWRTGSAGDPDTGERPKIPVHAAYGPRVAITCLFALGMLYLFLIIRTLKRYGATRGRGAEEAILSVGAEARNTASIVGDVGGSLAAVAVPLAGKEQVVTRGRTQTRQGNGGQRGRRRYSSSPPPPLPHHEYGVGRATESASWLGLVVNPLSKIETSNSV